MTPVDLDTRERWERENPLNSPALEEERMRLYIAGPMSWLPQFNFPVFDAAAAAFRNEGYEVVSPAELDEPETREAALASATGDPAHVPGKTWGDLLARDVKIVADEVDGVVLLPGWEDSKGARLESWLARHTGKPVFYSYCGPEWSEDGQLCHQEICHCHELGDFPDIPVLIELDDAELDRVFTLADLDTLYKIARDEGQAEVATLAGMDRDESVVPGLPFVDPILDAIREEEEAVRAVKAISFRPPPEGWTGDRPTRLFGFPVRYDSTIPEGAFRIETS
jgi:hypothetical protein